MANHDKPSEGSVTLTREQFEQLLARSAQPVERDDVKLLQAVAAMRPPGPWDDRITPERQKELRAPTPRKAQRVIAVIGESGSKSQILCQRGPKGETIGVSLVAGTYVYPRDILIPQKDGGRCPDGLQIAKDETAAMLIATAGDDKPVSALLGFLEFNCLQMVLDTCYRFDMGERGWMRKSGLKASDCDPEGQGLATPWDDELPVAAE